MLQVKDFYDKTATNWSEIWYNEKRMLPVLERFITMLKSKNSKVLDMGCGAGYEVKLMMELGVKNMSGADLSKELVKIAKKNVKGAKFFVHDIKEPMKKMGNFDGIFSLACIVHLSISELMDAFKNMHEVMNKDGVLLISVKDGMGKDVERSFTRIDNEHYDKNLNYYTAEQVAKFSEKYFRLVEEWQFNDYNRGWRYYLLKKI